MKKHLNIPRHGAPKGRFLSFALLALVATMAIAPVLKGGSTPTAPTSTGTREVASWTGYWTWDAKNRKWIWTWVWIWDGKPGWIVS